MKTRILLAVCALVVFTGCQEHAHQEKGSAPEFVVQKSHQHDAEGFCKYKNVYGEFPGHKYAVEIVENEETGLVSAHFTDAHFEPTFVNASEIKLQFVIDGTPKAYVLARSEQEEGKPSIFTATDKDLAHLLSDGWKGEATANIEIDGSPFIAELKKISGEESAGHAH